MHFGYAMYAVGAVVCAVALTMLFPLGYAVANADGSAMPLLASMVLSLIVGGALLLVFRTKEARVMSHREGMAVVALGWLAAGLFGALPFYFGGVFDSLVDAIFESVSGFTTTGASVLSDIESVPEGLLLWRSLTHWLGGMGIIVLSLAILPFLGVGGMQLYKAEVPGPAPDKLKPRIKDTALLLWKVYVLFTIAQTILLMLGGMTFFDAVCHTFGTMATGGFSTKNASIGHYHSAYFDWVIILFMFMAGVNFTLHYQMLRGRPRQMFNNPEFRFYTGVILAFTLLTCVSVHGRNYDNLLDTLRYSAFQVVSICTTTGYATADYELWPFLPQALLFFLMFMGGSAGSTGGGMKCMRLLLLLKHSYYELIKLVHPRAVKHIKLGGQIVKPEVLSGIWGFMVLYLGLFILASFIMAALGLDILTAFSSVAASIGNIGPGLGTVGPAENYAHIPALGKWVLLFCMLLGRLEIYTVIILLVPEYWRN